MAGLLLVDPLLVRSVGFGLSVGATAGIVLLAGPLAARLPGPRPLAEVLAVTMAAQLGAAPVLLAVFGPLPVAAVPANLLAVPAAAPVALWGLTAGLVAGAVDPDLARVLHLPTSLLVGWVAAVARTAAGWPLGQVGAPGVAVAAAGGVLLAVGRGRGLGVGGVAALAAVLVGSPHAVPPPPGAELAPGARVWVAGRPAAVVLVLDGRAGAGPLLRALRAAGVRRVDVLAAGTGGRPTADVVAVIRRRVPVRAVLAPRGHRIREAVVPAVGERATVGPLAVHVNAVAPRLEVHVTPAAPWAAGSVGGRAPPPG